MAMDQPLPGALSPSRLADFQQCPRRFQHSTIDRIPQPATYATAKGNVAHHMFEHLFKSEPAERTDVRARELAANAEDVVLTAKVKDEASLDESQLARMRREINGVVTSYFSMEDPRTVNAEGVELRLTQDLGGVTMLGILDRLDRERDGSLSIVDYKTGSLPNRRFDTQTFANTELYAALCEQALGERPQRIRLLYVAHGEAIERPVTESVTIARRKFAAGAWRKIEQYYDEGAFPATPSVNACRFCSYKQRCRDAGVAVPT